VEPIVLGFVFEFTKTIGIKNIDFLDKILRIFILPFMIVGFFLDSRGRWWKGAT
jgi:hypothetical protein